MMAIAHKPCHSMRTTLSDTNANDVCAKAVTMSVSIVRPSARNVRLPPVRWMAAVTDALETSATTISASTVASQVLCAVSRPVPSSVQVVTAAETPRASWERLNASFIGLWRWISPSPTNPPTSRAVSSGPGLSTNSPTTSGMSEKEKECALRPTLMCTR